MIDREPSAGDMLAIDPSVVSAGAALFRSGRLVAAKRITLGCMECGAVGRHLRDCSKPEEHDGARCLRMDRRIMEWVIDCPGEPRTLCYEWPKIYRVGVSECDPADLIALAAVGGGLAGMLAMGLAHRNTVLDVRTYEPAEWANGTRKFKKGDVLSSPRALRVLDRLSTDEAAVLPASHDAIDAVGIGLHALGRFAPKRVFPGAVPSPR